MINTNHGSGIKIKYKKMKKYSKYLLLITLMLLVFCLVPSLVNAQPDPGGDPDATVPIDGGLSFLAAAGVAYSVKKIKQYRKKSKGAE